MRKVSMDGKLPLNEKPCKVDLRCAFASAVRKYKAFFPENGYECFFVYIKKEEKMESEKIKAGVRLILEGLVKTETCKSNI